MPSPRTLSHAFSAQGDIGSRRGLHREEEDELTYVRRLGIAAVLTALTIAATGCGGGTGGGGTIIRGTTDQPISYDPAGAYDLPSYDVIYNVYQNVLTIPPGGNKPVPEAAQSCDFTNDTTYECTMKDGIKFSDGHPLTAEDVKFSFDRNVEIADPNGASSLLANLKSTDAPDDKTVIFHLKQPDATFPFVLTVASFAIVDSGDFPKDKLQPSDKVIGSGRYTVASYQPGQQTVLEKNAEYTGDDPAQNDRAIVQYFDKPSALKLAVQQGDVDIAYRSLSPTDINSLRDASGVNVVEGNAAKKTLADAGVKTPLPLEIWWTPTHYGTASGDEYAEIKHQLDSSGLFDVTLKSTEWNQYSTSAFTNKYPEYQLGWFPDYPDANDYTSPFYGKDSFLNIHYDNPEMNKLLAQEAAETDDAKRADELAKIQDIGAEDAPTIPIWQGKQIAAVRDGVNGVQDTFDPAFIFRYWLITKD